MFSRTRPSSQSYQVAAVCGEPSGRTVATTAGFGRARNSEMSCGMGVRGMLSSLALLVRPALEPVVRLPERHRLRPAADGLARVGELGAAVRDELVLAGSAEDELGPVEQLESQRREMR